MTAVTSANLEGFNFYVNNVTGNDSNNGRTQATPLKTLSALTTAAIAYGHGVKIALAKGSTWRESLNLGVLNNVTVGSYGSGNPPVVTGFNVVADTWTQDGTHTNLWYVGIAHDGTGTNRPAVLDDGELMYRRTSLASANSNAGSYFSPDAGSANPLRVHIHPAGNPNSDGHTYEIVIRAIAVFLGDGAKLSGVAARGAMSNNGPIECGLGSTIRQCVSAFGTKHNLLLESGVIEDVVLYESDAPSASEPGVTMFVGFTADATGFSLTARRMFGYTERVTTAFAFSHTLNDPDDAYASITYEQCGCYFNGGGGTGFDGGAVAMTVDKCFAYGSITAPVSLSTPTADISYFLGRQSADIDNQVIGGIDVSWSQVAIVRSGVSGGSKRQIGIQPNASVTVDHVSTDTPADYFGDSIGWVSSTGGSVAVNRSLIEANNGITVPTGSDYNASNHNVFVRTDIGPFATYHGTAFNLSSDIAGWRTATGRDANSIALTSSPYSGNTANGDFRVTASALTGAGHDGNAGVTEHWDYNLRQVVAGPPDGWPVVPVTYAEALTYILNPTGWNFYP